MRPDDGIRMLEDNVLAGGLAMVSVPRSAPRPRRVVRGLSGLFLQAPELDVGLALAAFLALLIDRALAGPAADFTAAIWALSAAASLPLILRRRYPLGVLITVVAAVIGCLAVFHPNRAAVGVVMVAVYTVGLQGSRRKSLAVGAAMAPIVALAVLVTSTSGGEFDFTPMVANLALITIALIAGDARRGRLALVRALAEEERREKEAAERHLFDEQRVRLAHELHDSVAHALVAINVRAAAAAHLERGAPSESSAALEEIKRTSADALNDLRSTLRMLRSASDEAPMRPAQTLADLPDLVDGLAGSGVVVELHVAVAPEQLPAAVGHVGYRIVQEALTNILRHSTAHRAEVDVTLADGALTVEVRDDGRPRHREHSSPGHGLKGMVERSASLGGTCVAGTMEGGGWRVWARLPVTRTR
jgi:signal transduction histidine kinase